jgi:dGTPase
MTGQTGYAGYAARDRERWVDEPPKRRERTSFERDRARVLHSAALRGLAAKTQVVDLAASDRYRDHHGQHSPRTRLTHSLECAQIGRELGKAFGCDPDLTEVACLSHDLGHPPFGHNGEAVLDSIAAACGGFEGNAQSLRLLTRLEAKSFGADGRSAGLNLTRAALDAAMKYPWTRRNGDPKYGVYSDDRPVFSWVRSGAPAERLCFEAQVMDWSDDVAYSVHDLEDGLHAGHIRLSALASRAERRAVCELTASLYCDAEPGELEERFTVLLAEAYWPHLYDGTLRTLAALKNLTSELIGRFCRAAEEATHAAYGRGPLTRYAADLVVPRAQRLECALLKGIAAYYVMRRASHEKAQAHQREIIAELTAALTKGAPWVLAPVFRDFHEEASDDAGRLRAIVDQVASLTDTAALAWHSEIAG